MIIEISKRKKGIVEAVCIIAEEAEFCRRLSPLAGCGCRVWETMEPSSLGSETGPRLMSEIKTRLHKFEASYMFAVTVQWFVVSCDGLVSVVLGWTAGR